MAVPASRKEDFASVRNLLMQMEKQIAMALPAHLTPDRMIRIALTAIQTTPKLLECDRNSLLQAIMTASALGLEPDGVLGQAYLVPFKGKVQFIPGYKGLITLAYQSNELSSIQAQPVYQNDLFDYEYGTDEKMRHKPLMFGDRGELIGFYSYARFKNGAFAFEVMSVSDVNKIRDNSEGYKSMGERSPWGQHYVQMGRKTLIRRLANYLPRSVQKASALDSAHDAGKIATIDMELGEVIEHDADDGAPQEEKTRATRSNRQKQTLDAVAAKPKDELPHDPDTGEIVDEAPRQIEAPREEPIKTPAKVEEKREPAPAARQPDPEPEPEEESLNFFDGADEG